MKRFIVSLISVLALATSAFAGVPQQPYSFLSPGVTYIQLKGGAAGQGITNLDSFQKFPQANGSFVMPVNTNVSVLFTNIKKDAANGFIIVATNITAAGSVTNTVASVTNVYGTGLSNCFLGYTSVIGPVQAGVHGITNNTFNLLGTVALPNDVINSRQVYPGGNNTNSWGTLQFTTIADGTNVCNFTFVALPDGVNEDTDGRGTFNVGVTNALGIRTSEAAIPIFLPGIKALRLQSITSTGGGVASQANQVGILGVNLITDAP